MIALYFAYGSNMNLEGKLREWAPTARVADIGQVRNRRLTFARLSSRWGDRAADILPHATAVTWGALFDVDPADIPGIDACEGAPRAYRRIELEVTTGSSVVPAFSYEVVDRHLPEALPAAAYIATMLAGARAVGLPGPWIAYLEAIEGGTFATYPG